MPYTKIPRSNIAESVSTVIGKVAGVVVSSGNKSLDKIENTLESMQKRSSELRQKVYNIQSEAILKATEFEQEATRQANEALTDAATTAYQAFLDSIVPGTQVRVDVNVGHGTIALRQEAIRLLNTAASQVEQLLLDSAKVFKEELAALNVSLGAVENSLTVVAKTASTLRDITRTLRIPLVGLRATVATIKMIPLPQRYLVVSFTILQSDLLEKMEQLIYQAEESVRSIEAVLNLVEKILMPIRERIRRIRAILSLITVNNLTLSASSRDLGVLESAGLYNRASRQTIFDVVQEGQRMRSRWELYGNIDAKLINSKVEYQIQNSNPGDCIQLLGYPSGSYVENYYKWQEEKPSYPRNIEKEGWTRFPEKSTDSNQKLWMVEQYQAGGQAYRTVETEDSVLEVSPTDWDELFSFVSKVKNLPNDSSESVSYDPLLGFRWTGCIPLLDENTFAEGFGIVRPSSWDALELAALNAVRNLPLSSDLQGAFRSLWQESAIREASTSTTTSDSVTYRASNGELYYLQVVEDDHSPKVASRRYVQAKDKSGTVVLEGLKTFSLDKEVLIEEMKIQLDQLTR